MERFVTLITGYDPEVVKNDNSPVYLDWAREFDLVSKVDVGASGKEEEGEGEGEGGGKRGNGTSKRTTRRRLQKREEEFRIVSGVVRSPSPSPSHAPVPVGETTTTTRNGTSGFPSSLVDRKGKEKTKATATANGKDQQSNLIDNGLLLVSSSSSSPSTISFQKPPRNVGLSSSIPASTSRAISPSPLPTRESKRMSKPPERFFDAKLGTMRVGNSREKGKSRRGEPEGDGEAEGNVGIDGIRGSKGSLGLEKGKSKKAKAVEEVKAQMKARQLEAKLNGKSRPNRKARLRARDTHLDANDEHYSGAEEGFEIEKEEEDEQEREPFINPYDDVLAFPPRWTHALQRPEGWTEHPFISASSGPLFHSPTPPFDLGRSLEDVLGGWRLVDESGKEMDDSQSQNHYHSRNPNMTKGYVMGQARMRNRIRQLQSQGRLLAHLDTRPPPKTDGQGHEGETGFSTPVLEEGGGAGSGGPIPVPSRSSDHHRQRLQQQKQDHPRLPDHHDALLGHVVQLRTHMLNQYRARITGSRKIAKLIEAHWDFESSKDDRARKEEERQQRLVMRTLVKAIKAKWKLAANVVRAKKMAEAKLEREKVGKQQLQTMLQHSTGLLQAGKTAAARSESVDDDVNDDEYGDDEQKQGGGEENSEQEEEPEMLHNPWEERDYSDEDEDDEEEEEEEKGENQEQEQEVKNGEEGEDLRVLLAEEQEDALTETDHDKDGLSEHTNAKEGDKPADPIHITISQVEMDVDEAPTAPDESRHSPALTSVTEQIDTTSAVSPIRSSPTVSAINGRTPSSPRAPAEDLSNQLPSAAYAATGEERGPEPVNLMNPTPDHESPPTSSGKGVNGGMTIGVGRSDGIAPEPPRTSSRLQRKRRGGTLPHPFKRIKVEETDPDADDVEYKADHPDLEIEDLVLDEEMDAEELVSDDSEDEGLAEDADLPLDQLLKRYGYNDDAIDRIKNRTTGETHEEPSEGDSDSASEAARESAIDKVEEEVQEMEEIEKETESDFPVPFLLRAKLRPYQLAGLEWLANAYKHKINAILADEMGLGKTIQTIALLAHLACDYGIWGPHLIVVPTSVILNWEMEFKKFLPGFKILTYYGTQEERKKKRKGWQLENAFQVCITSYQLALSDQHIFRRWNWQYMVLDEAHNIKNFRSQRWQTLLGFKSQRRLLLTGTPLQNNLMELWSLLYFLMPQGVSAQLSEAGGFANHLEFNEWFSNPMDKAIERGDTLSEETRSTIGRLHVILRPYILRRLKAEVETQLPGKHEHVIYCSLSKRQRFLYDEFMSRSSTRHSLMAGGYLGVANCLMQLRKVCNHPDLFEVRPIRTSFAMTPSVPLENQNTVKAIERLLRDPAPIPRSTGMLDGKESSSTVASRQRLDASEQIIDDLGFYSVADLPKMDVRTKAGWKTYRDALAAEGDRQRRAGLRSINQARCRDRPVFGYDLLKAVGIQSPTPHGFDLDPAFSEETGDIIDRFAFVTPNAVAPDLASKLFETTSLDIDALRKPEFDSLHHAQVRLQIAFPDRSLLQYDCGKLQVLAPMLKDLKAGGHRVIIFTQMTRMLDILETFLNFHGHTYSRLDGRTKIEDRLLITERFNASPRIFAFIASTRSGGVGINLTGADTVIFYDNEFNPAMDKQAQDRAHRIGQTREVNIYRLVTLHTVEENMLKKANQKRLLDDVVIQGGNFTTDYLAKTDLRDVLGDDFFEGDSDAANKGEIALTSSEMQSALAQAEDEEDHDAAQLAETEIIDAADFGEAIREPSVISEKAAEQSRGSISRGDISEEPTPVADDNISETSAAMKEETLNPAAGDEEVYDDDEPGVVDEYMLRMVEWDWDSIV